MLTLSWVAVGAASRGANADVVAFVDSLQARGADLLSRVVSGIFFVLLSRDLVQEYLRTRHLTGLLLLLSESLVVMLIIWSAYR